MKFPLKMVAYIYIICLNGLRIPFKLFSLQSVNKQKQEQIKKIQSMVQKSYTTQDV